MKNHQNGGTEPRAAGHLLRDFEDAVQRVIETQWNENTIPGYDTAYASLHRLQVTLETRANTPLFIRHMTNDGDVLEGLINDAIEQQETTGRINPNLINRISSSLNDAIHNAPPIANGRGGRRTKRRKNAGRRLTKTNRRRRRHRRSRSRSN